MTSLRFRFHGPLGEPPILLELLQLLQVAGASVMRVRTWMFATVHEAVRASVRDFTTHETNQLQGHLGE